MEQTKNGGVASASLPTTSRVADGSRRGGSATIHPNACHPNACHPNACMSSEDGTRYCGWLLHGHPWCGTHGHKCEELPLLQVDSKGRGS